jgi:biopolymer transport protein ExbB/TolQ
MLIIYLAVVITALYWVIKILAPEMAKPSIYPRRKPVSNHASLEAAQENGPENRMEKVESLLMEKNKNIQLLQMELKILHVQVNNFDKVKILLEEEIHRLREQNRIFRSELGLPAIQSPQVSSPITN